MTKALNWKFTLPFGAIWLAIFHDSALAIVGSIAVIFGIIDLILWLKKK